MGLESDETPASEIMHLGLLLCNYFVQSGFVSLCFQNIKLNVRARDRWVIVRKQFENITKEPCGNVVPQHLHGYHWKLNKCLKKNHDSFDSIVPPIVYLRGV